MTFCIIPSPLCLIHILWRVQPTSPTHPKQRHSSCGTGSVTWSSTNVTMQPLGCKSHKKRPVGCLHEGNHAPAMTRFGGGTFQHLASSLPPSTHAQSGAWCARHSSNQICKTRLRCGSLNVSGWLLFPVLAAGRPFPVTVCEKRATRSISRQHPSRILRSILRPIAQPRVKELPFDAPGSGCPPAELNMCRLIGCDEIRRPWCIVCLNLGHLGQWEDCPEEWKMRTCFVLDRRLERDRHLSLTRADRGARMFAWTTTVLMVTRQ